MTTLPPSPKEVLPASGGGKHTTVARRPRSIPTCRGVSIDGAIRELACGSGRLHNARMHPHGLRRLIVPLLVTMAAAACSRNGATPVDSISKPLAVAAAEGSLSPNLATGAGGTLLLSWVEPRGEAHRLRYSVFGDGAWSEPRTAANGGDWFVNWADFPSVVPVSDSLWAAHWLVSQPAGGYAYDVLLSLSADRGETWSKARMPHDDGTPTEHGFVTLFPQQGELGVIWLDGRNMARPDHGGDSLHGMTLRAARVDTDLRIAGEAVVDDLTCDCCQTDVAATADGAIAVYRNRTANETRDIYAARLQDGAWQPGRAVADDGWIINGCPVNGPVIAADGERVAIAWFTAADDRPRVRLAESRDAGVTFASPVDVARGGTSGHVGLVLLPRDGAAVSWTCERPNGHTGVCLRAVAGADGGAVHVLSGDAEVPAFSVPQLARHDDVLVAAWTENTDGGSAIASARIPIAALR